MFFSPYHNTSSHRKWRDAVKKETGNVCFITGLRGDFFPLEAHHLYDAKNHKKLRTVVANGVMILRPLHKAFHLLFMGGYKVKCTPKDLVRFKRIYDYFFKRFTKAT